MQFVSKYYYCLIILFRFKAHKDLLEYNFAIVGDDGMSKEPQSGVLVKESESVYTLWCTGRQYCEGMLVELRLLKRHDLVSVMGQLIRPKSEIIKITVYMDEDMDNFVFALLPRKQASKYQKELQDLVKIFHLFFQISGRYF